MECLPDIQCTQPAVKIPLKRVGVENIELPFLLNSKYGGFRHLNANVSMGVNLEENVKGISMSRLLLTLKPYLDLPLKRVLIKEILQTLNKNVGGTTSFIKFEFRMPLDRKSILSDFTFPVYYKCQFEGQLYKIKDVQSNDDLDWPLIDEFRFYQGIKIQYASYCPCSAELCYHLDNTQSIKGYPHNQRSYADILVEVIDPHYVWLEDLIEIFESQIKTLPYPIIKRVDEQEIARVAAENPLFVEDAIRLLSHAFNQREDIYDWLIKCKHEESIHTSEAIAVNWKGVPGGLNEKRYL